MKRFEANTFVSYLGMTYAVLSIGDASYDATLSLALIAIVFLPTVLCDINDMSRQILSYADADIGMNTRIPIDTFARVLLLLPPPTIHCLSDRSWRSEGSSHS
jgi:hypothetical protein